MIVIDLLYSLFALVALSIISGFIETKFKGGSIQGKILQGLLFGIIAITGMLRPFVLEEGIIFDGRSVVISLCTLFFGPVAGTISAIMSIIYRIIIGGGGTITGVSVIIASLITGYIFYRARMQGKFNLTIGNFYLFGLIVNLIMMLLMTTLPSNVVEETFQTITLTVLGVYPIITILIGKVLQDFEEKNRNYELLKENEKKFHGYIENAPYGIFVMNQNSELIDVNSTACILSGYPKDKLLTMKVSELFAPKSLVDGLNFIKGVQKTGFSYNILSIRRSDETVKWWGFTATTLSQNTYLGFAEDVSEKLNSDFELKESEQKFKDIFQNHSAVKLLINSVTGDIIDANIAAGKFYGWSTQELKQMNISQINTLSPERLAKEMSKVISRAITHLEFVHRLKDGTLRDVEVFTSPLLLSGKTVIHSIVQDVSKKKEAEKLNKLLSLTVDKSPFITIITDKDGIIHYINPRFTEITGFEKHEAIGNKPSILRSDFQPNEYYKQLWDTITNGEEWRGEFFNKKKSGELYWSKTIITPLFDENGEITFYISVSEDVTQVKKLIAELITSKEKAEEMNRLKSHFFATMSHELRTPFVGILGFTELLLEEDIQGEARKYIEGIHNSSQRLTETLTKILDITKLEFSEIFINNSSFELTAIINEIYNHYSPAAQKKGISFVKEFNNDSLKVVTDEKLIRDILSNLVSNAIKYTQKGEVKISAGFYGEENKELVICVADTGLGIPLFVQEQIWEEFRQVSEGYGRVFEGTGLGLTIVKKYTTLLGATISLQSEEGKGSSFTFKLPLEENS